MNITFYINGRKSTKKIYVRLYQNKLDVACSTDLIIFREDWSEENEQSKSDSNLNEILANLKLQILKNYNASLSSGKIICTAWLKEVIKNTFNRPLHEKDLVNDNFTIYFSDFADYWMKEHSGKWKTSARKLMSKTLISQYKKFLEDFKIYEGTLNGKILLKELGQEAVYQYIDYLQDKEYAVSTIKRSFLGRMAFFMNRASALKFETATDFNENVFIENEDELDGVYLSEAEIKRIVDKDFSFDQELNIAKQNYLILLYTGLRGTDGLKNLDISNIKDGMIKIKTQKTGQNVVIPLHQVVLDVIKQNFGNLPPRINLDAFNKAIKTICMLCDIDEVIEGKLYDQEKQRKVRNFYPKWKLISSHSCRRGFATIHYGKLPNEVICSVLGWSSETMLRHYNQTTKTDYANVLKKHWDEN